MSIAPNPGAAGYLARMNREPIRSCPDKGRDHQRAWEAGWLRADKVREAQVSHVVFAFRYLGSESFTTLALSVNEDNNEAEVVLAHAKSVGLEWVGTWYVFPKKLVSFADLLPHMQQDAAELVGFMVSS